MKHIKSFELFEHIQESNTMEIHSPTFKRWFGDWESNPEQSSKVVDTNGEPLVVYHGGTSDLIQEFKSNFDGIFFTDNIEVAEEFSGVTGLNKPEYSQQIIDILNTPHDSLLDLFNVLKPHGFSHKWERERGIYGETKEYYLLVDKDGNEYKISLYQRPSDLIHDLVKRGKNYTVYLNMRNPLIHDAKNRAWDNIAFNGKTASTMEISLYAKENGYDGVILQNVYEAYKKSNVYVVYDSNQVKIIR
jgi:hypothetical protein